MDISRNRIYIIVLTRDRKPLTATSREVLGRGQGIAIAT